MKKVAGKRKPHSPESYARAARTRRRNKAFRRLNEMYAKHGFMLNEYCKGAWYMQYREEWQPGPVRPRKKKPNRGSPRVVYIYAVTDNYGMSCSYRSAEFLKVYSPHEAVEFLKDRPWHDIIVFAMNTRTRSNKCWYVCNDMETAELISNGLKYRLGALFRIGVCARFVEPALIELPFLGAHP